MEDEVVAHITAHLDPDAPSHPLFVAVQGPQGSGKTYLCANLKERLSAAPHSLKVAVLSIDDLYLPHDGLVALANQTPHNPLWAGRGQPGTHDIELGKKLVKALRGQSGTVELPIFEKSLFDGEGDRLPGGISIPLPVDVVILEGWCVGFHPISFDELGRRWEDVYMKEIKRLDLPSHIKLDDIQRANEALEQYCELWGSFDVFIQV
jgi:D-glycerate 3-kinase